MSRARPIPTFALYGEQGASRDDGLHVEEIQSRSRLYRWEIDAHVHRALYQVVCVLEGPAQVSLDEQRVRIEGSGVVVIPPGVVHEFHCTGTENLVFLVITSPPDDVEPSPAK